MKEDPGERPPPRPGTSGRGGPPKAERWLEREREAELLVRNLQRGVVLDRSRLLDFFRKVAAELDSLRRDATLALVTDERMRALNREYRGLDKPTDVLAFRADPPYLGDVVISVETAERQARRRGSKLERELRVLTLHGFLHLLGYDHETDDGEMRRLEYRLRRKLGITTPRARKRK